MQRRQPIKHMKKRKPFKNKLSDARVLSVITTLNIIVNHFGKTESGEPTIMFNKNNVHILFDGKLKHSVSLRNLRTIIN
jgi:hypothetical protein